jgi:cell division protein FtsQ
VKQSTHKKRRNRYKKSKRQSSGVFLKRLTLALKCIGMLALLLAASMMFVLTYATITTSDYFNAKIVDVRGNHRISRPEILAQAGFEAGDNILALNLRLIRKRLISHPWINTAQVSRQIPHTIIIRVEEHHPLAALDLGQRLLINEHGRIFKEYTAGDPDHLPVITGIDYTDLSLENQPITEPMETIIHVLQLSRKGESVLPYNGIARLHVDKETGVTLTMREKERLIKLGFGQFAKKNQKIRQLLEYLENKPQWQDICALDAHNPDRIVVTPGSALQAKSTGA